MQCGGKGKRGGRCRVVGRGKVDFINLLDIKSFFSKFGTFQFSFCYILDQILVEKVG